MALLHGKVCIVTGAAAGIGAAITRLFLTQGAVVYTVDRDAHDTGSHAYRFDVRDAPAMASLVKDATARYGRIDVLVNNAGIYPRRSFVEMTEAEWDEMFDVNMKSIFHATKLVLPHMVEQRSGKIVNMSSINFFRGGAKLTHYTATKAAIIGFSRSLSREVGPFGVYVNCVTPGAVETETEKRVADPVEIAALVEQQSIRRRILPVDVARVCLFLASELSDGMTGQTVNVDGGRILH
jgi:3-oxoacyl-[acyl-carrier protein] reductase